MSDSENEQLTPPNRQIQIQIIQIPPTSPTPDFPDPADLLIPDGATATANIIRSATSLPTTITREIHLPPPNPRCTASEYHHVEASPERSVCRCHVMRMNDNTILWFVVNDVEVDRRRRNRPTRRSVPESLSTVRSSDSGPFCRICFLGTEDGPLLRVCHCRGTVGMVHHKCVLVWTMQRQSYSCEICHYPYNLQVNGLRWCWRWIYPIPRGQIATQCLLFLMSWIVMVFSIASLVFITFNLSTLFPDEITAGVFIIMNSFTLLCSIGILLTQSMYPIRSLCQRFCLANLELEILPYEETDESLARMARTQHPTASSSQSPTLTAPNSLPHSISTPNVSSFAPCHPMTIPSVQLDEMVRSNQAILGSLRESNHQTRFQEENQQPRRLCRIT